MAALKNTLKDFIPWAFLWKVNRGHLSQPYEEGPYLCRIKKHCFQTNIPLIVIDRFLSIDRTKYESGASIGVVLAELGMFFEYSTSDNVELSDLPKFVTMEDGGALPPERVAFIEDLVAFVKIFECEDHNLFVSHGENTVLPVFFMGDQNRVEFFIIDPVCTNCRSMVCEDTRCPLCEFGLYCSPDCLNADADRHSEICQTIFKVTCFYCKKTSNKINKSCAGCTKVRYCSRDCQVADWKTHKLVCKKE